MPNANPFADFIEEEKHAHLLEAGNLGPKKKSPTQPGADWNSENSWTSLGYSAAVTRLTCSCGASRTNLVGVFHCEKTPSGATRQTALSLRNFQVTLGENYPITLVEEKTTICPDCLPAKGFFYGENL